MGRKVNNQIRLFFLSTKPSLESSGMIIGDIIPNTNANQKIDIENPVHKNHIFFKSRKLFILPKKTKPKPK